MTKPRYGLASIALLTMTAIMLVMAQYIPSNDWRPSTAVALFLFAASFGYLIYLPGARQKVQDVGALVQIAPRLALAVPLLLWTGVTLTLSLCDAASDAVWMMNVLGLGCFLLALRILHIAVSAIDSDMTGKRGTPAPIRWHTALIALQQQAMIPVVQQHIGSLLAQIRSTLDIPQDEAGPDDARISELIKSSLTAAVQSQQSELALGIIKDIALLLARRSDLPN